MMSVFELPAACGCRKPDCYFCWLAGRVYSITGVDSRAKNVSPIRDLMDPEEVLQEICRMTGTSADVIRSKSRRNEIVIVRQAYCYVAREITGATTKRIGDVINRDHSTVSCSYRVIEDAMDIRDRDVMKVMDKIKMIW